MQEFKSESYDALDSFSMKRTSPNNRMPDQYTEALFREYEYRMPRYSEPIIDYFIEEHLDDLKEKHKDKKHTIPENISFTPKKTVELIARWQATDSFLKRLNKYPDNVDIKVLLDKMRLDYQEPEPKQTCSDGNDAEKPANEKDLTMRQQVIILTYMLEALGSKFVDKTVTARFVKKLTGKNYDNIYDAVREPHKYNDAKLFKKDMKVVREEFMKLDLQDLANKVLKDSDNL